MLRNAFLLWCLYSGLLSCRSDTDLSIVFGGDVMLDRGIRAKINVHGPGYFFDDLKAEFQDSDFVVVNLECPATAIKAPLTKKYIFRAEPALLPELRKAGITHCILANNHSYDQGRDGLISTAENLQKAGIVPVGYGPTQQLACAPVILRKDNSRVAIFSSVTLALESWMYLEDTPGMCQATIEDLAKSISAYKAAHKGDYVIVTLHWGIEYQLIPTPLQRDQAKALVEAGADAIIGHHPHVVQRYERIDGKPVFYSIGNLIFDNPNPITQNGILVRLRISGQGVASEIIPYKTEDLKPVPY
jgi:poly-gamma-glutamate capsule biosynthesis protein CapA/YwtB (metallophosphatase superfamily)